MSEVASMANINICNENLVKLHGGCIDGPSRILVYDYMKNGSLSQTFLENLSGSWRTKIGFCLVLVQHIHYASKQAWGMYKSKELLHLVDPLLSGRFNKNEAIRLLKVGLLCVQEKPNIRPLMSTVTRIMNDEIDIHEVEISQPGLLTDIMDVKVGQRRSSQSNSRIRKRSSQQLNTL
ncbi:hypothetical protein AB3S75_036892 [Citrus x aurantiifolia]